VQVENVLEGWTFPNPEGLDTIATAAVPEDSESDDENENGRENGTREDEEETHNGGTPNDRDRDRRQDSSDDQTTSLDEDSVKERRKRKAEKKERRKEKRRRKELKRARERHLRCLGRYWRAPLRATGCQAKFQTDSVECVCTEWPVPCTERIRSRWARWGTGSFIFPTRTPPTRRHGSIADSGATTTPRSSCTERRRSRR
jgi:hypothetical protein